jgi:hypothetical protein
VSLATGSAPSITSTTHIRQAAARAQEGIEALDQLGMVDAGQVIETLGERPKKENPAGAGPLQTVY